MTREDMDRLIAQWARDNAVGWEIHGGQLCATTRIKRLDLVQLLIRALAAEAQQ